MGEGGGFVEGVGGLRTIKFPQWCRLLERWTGMYELRVGQGRGFLLVCVFALLLALALLTVLDRCF